MDFYAAQDEARKKTGWLLVMFLLCVVGVVLAVSALAWAVSMMVGQNNEILLEPVGKGLGRQVPWELLVTTGVGTVVLILGASGFKGLQLRGGGGVVARDLGGRLVDPSTTETHERRLLNVVEEMAIASGTPVPQVYVMDEEEGINAFAAGTEPGNAAIGVTRGCLLRLSRAELQGVIAHEFSHILNGDMKLNMRLIGWVFGLVIISILGRGLFESLRFVRVSGSRDDKGGGAGIVIALLVLGLGLMAIGGIGVFFARLLQAAVSRQREFLADASAVQFTREPNGIAGALKKIGGQGSRIRASKATEASHCFFADGGLFAFGLATHPPLNLRISRIEKDWDGKFVDTVLPPIADEGEETEGGGEDERVSGLAGAVALGSPERVQVRNGKAIREELDPRWKAAVHGRDEAQSLIFGLLLAEDRELRLGEIDYLQKEAGRMAAGMALDWQRELGALHSAKKIALIDVAVPTLRGLSLGEYERFLEITRHLIGSDGRVDVFEYMLQRLIEHHLENHFRRRGPGRVRFHRVEDLAGGVELLLSAFANLNPAPEQAFEEGAECLGLGGGLVPAGEISLVRINAVLERLEEAAPPVKGQVLEACAAVIASDEHLSNREVELLRAMADGIGCAVPPLVENLARI